MKRIFLVFLIFVAGCDRLFFLSSGKEEALLSFTIFYDGETVVELENRASAGLKFDVPLAALELDIKEGATYLKKSKVPFETKSVLIPHGGHMLLFADVQAYGYKPEDLKLGSRYKLELQYVSKAEGGWKGHITGEGSLLVGKWEESLPPSFIYYTVFDKEGGLVESRELTKDGWKLLCYPCP